MELKYTKHAEHMVRERDLPRSLIEAAVNGPDSKETDKDGMVHFFKKKGNKVLRVVVRIENNSHI